MRKFVVVGVALCVTGCATAPPMLWVRLDGQRTRDNPVLQQDLQVAQTICLGERQKAALSGVTVANGGLAAAVAAQERGAAADQVGQGCMAEKGYALVPADQAEEKLTQFAAVAAEKKQQEVAAANPSAKRK